jgi:hypothetical protein|tara:strand:- start:191 stop:622 length:432 start_codon:yes stop_codon:yes gene_type:complete
MANIQLQRGQQQQVDVTYKLANATDALILNATHSNGAAKFDAELVIRKKRGDSFMGQIIDVLRHGATSPTASSEVDSRILFNYSAAGPNIQLKWSTAQASLLPNEDVTVYGDLKVFTLNDSGAVEQTAHHIRLTFDIKTEITA